MAANYGMVTTGGGCSSSGAVTLEDGTLAVAAGIKAKNPKALVSGGGECRERAGECSKAKRPVGTQSRNAVAKPW